MKAHTLPYSALLFAVSAYATAPYPGAGWVNTLFLDDFNGPAGSLPSNSEWRYDTGMSYPGGPAQWGTGEVETYTTNSDNLRLSGSGTLLITPQVSNGQWTSARIETQSASFQAPAGGKMRVEASIMLPNIYPTIGLGYWPAFWALGESFRNGYTDWPACGEFDIMESVDGNPWTSYTMHCGTINGGPCDETTGLSSRANCPGSSCLGNYHTYTLIIDRSVSPEELYFQVDGNTEFTISESSVGTSTWEQTVHQGIFLILNVAIGGSYPNAVGGTTPNGNTQPGNSMEVDYVAVWTT